MDTANEDPEIDEATTSDKDAPDKDAPDKGASDEDAVTDKATEGDKSDKDADKDADEDTDEEKEEEEVDEAEASEREIDETDDDKSNWDLVVAYRGTTQSAVGDAQILCKYLDARTEDGELFWLEWTKQNEPLGREAWWFVGQLARKRMYIFIPAVLDDARMATNATKFKSKTSKLLAKRFLDLALSQQKQGRHRRDNRTRQRRSTRRTSRPMAR